MLVDADWLHERSDEVDAAISELVVRAHANPTRENWRFRTLSIHPLTARPDHNMQDCLFLGRISFPSSKSVWNLRCGGMWCTTVVDGLPLGLYHRWRKQGQRAHYKTNDGIYVAWR